MTWGSGKVYDGMWVHDKRTGPGKMTHPDGKVEEGEFKDGKFLGEIAKDIA